MAFENNQQDAFNQRNDANSLKQTLAEADQLTAAIGAAETAAEAELAKQKLTNLVEQQKIKIKQLDRLIAREEAGIRKLAALRLELSNKQFEARKKEIQKELKLLEDAKKALQEAEGSVENLAKNQASNTNSIAAVSNAKPVDTAAKVPLGGRNSNTDPSLIKLVGSINKTLNSLQSTTITRNDIERILQTAAAEDHTTKATEASKGVAESTQPELVSLVGSIDKTLASLLETVASNNTVPKDDTTDANGKASASKESKDLQKDLAQTGNNGGKSDKSGDAPTPKENNYFSGDAGLDPVDIGRFSHEAVVNTYKELGESIKAIGAKATLDKATATVTDEKGNTTSAVSQGTTDLAGELLVEVKKANAAEAKLQEFNENKKLNMRLAQLTEEQRLREAHDTKAYNNRINKANAFAKKQDVILNEEVYQEEALYELKVGHINKETELRLAGIKEEARAKDLLQNKESYEQEAQIANQNELKKRQNDIVDTQIKNEQRLAFIRENRDKLLAAERAERENEILDSYAEHLLKAGEYAVDLEEYKADAERKRQKATKKETIGKTTDALKKFGTGEFSMTDVKRSAKEYIGERSAELQAKGAGVASAKMVAAMELVAEAAGSLAEALDAKVKEISSMQGIVDTRLQGSRINDRDFGNGSYWNELLEEIKLIAGVSPFVKQEKIVDNVKELVDKGISFDIKQRAFLMTIQEKIANTFNVADGTLLRLIRIQQQDTTAGRLGMESALNSFLNRMYETSEYLSDVAASVRGSLEEMQALMEGKDATELEYQVQKWMGSLYSVGMSQEAVQNIAQTFGQIASGDISGLSGNGAGNLLIMAANEAGMSIADILQDGLKADETNKLMQAMVNYLAEIAESSSDSKVVQQQLANVYGIRASDLRAATNLSSSLKAVAKKDESYFGMMLQLNNMMNTIGRRTSIGEGMTNMWDNVMYSMASTQASNPMLYLLPKMANLLKDVTGGSGGGGIALPFINVSGFGVDLNTTVADLMSVASMAGTALGALGPALIGLTDLVNPAVGTTMLMRAGINPLSGAIRALTQGTASILQNVGGAALSASGKVVKGKIVGNSDGMSIKEQTQQSANDDKKKLQVEAKEEESADDVIAKGQQAVISIYNLLEEIAHGTSSLRVRLVNNSGGSVSNSGYGSGGGTNNLIGEGSGNGSTGAMGNNTLTNGTTGGSDNGNWILAF